MNPVDQLKAEYDSILQYLEDNNQISLLSDLNKSYPKVLLLSAGSYFEHALTKILVDFVNKTSNNDIRIINFLQKQAISLKYHTLFSWGEKDKPEKPVKNANTFFKLFGDDFKANIDGKLVEKNEDSEEVRNMKKHINESIAAFVEIGHLRNILVHSNFAAYSYDQKTTEEIYNLYKKAEPFLDFVGDNLISD